jgi:hypothetical protein
MQTVRDERRIRSKLQIHEGIGPENGVIHSK